MVRGQCALATARVSDSSRSLSFGSLRYWNAADAIPWYLSDFGVAPTYEGFRKGFQQVPLTIAARFEAAGGTIERNIPLLGFD
jgi:hypothetical protein